MPFVSIVVATFCNNWVLLLFILFTKFIDSPVETDGLGISYENNFVLFIYLILIQVQFQ